MGVQGFGGFGVYGKKCWCPDSRTLLLNLGLQRATHAPSPWWRDPGTQDPSLSRGRRGLLQLTRYYRLLHLLVHCHSKSLGLIELSDAQDTARTPGLRVTTVRRTLRWRRPSLLLKTARRVPVFLALPRVGGQFRSSCLLSSTVFHRSGWQTPELRL